MLVIVLRNVKIGLLADRFPTPVPNRRCLPAALGWTVQPIDLALAMTALRGVGHRCRRHDSLSDSLS